MDIFVNQSDAGRATLRFVGDLVIGYCPMARAKVTEALDAGAQFICLDFEEVPFIDSAGLGLLIALRQTVRAKGAEFVLKGVNSRILPLFKLTRLDKIFELE